MSPAGGPTSLISLGRCEVSRLIVGHNPPCGNSHLNEQLNEEMAAYFTTANVLALYGRAEELGLRALVIRGDYRMLEWLELYRRGGGRMNIIGQTASEMHDVFANIRILAAAGAAAVYHHGTATDEFWQQGRIDDCLPYLKCMRDCGVAVGLATHIPEVIEHAQARGWDVDFYLASLYNISRVPRESLLVTGDAGAYAREPYLEEDRRRMLTVILATPKPVLAFKVLAAGRLCGSPDTVRSAFVDAYSSIKPTDGVIVGLFPKHFDQVQADLEHATHACRQPPSAGR
ncbi:MAG: hypothetical protein MUP47_08995 [Phycisphaerae bacterium]|nr:hypothetical protein [Phycisphaerae bacterium]